jgi:hypothetical protein
VLKACAKQVAYRVELMADHVGSFRTRSSATTSALHKAFTAARSISRIQQGVRYTQVKYVDGMENPAEAMPDAARWLFRAGTRTSRGSWMGMGFAGAPGLGPVDDLGTTAQHRM